MEHYKESPGAVLAALDSAEGGLTASAAEERLAREGKNKLAEGKKVGVVRRFFAQLADPMIIVLLVAAVLSAFVAIVEHETPSDVIIILAVVLLNAVLGVLQESKAEKAIDALKKMTAATSKVLRDGEIKHLASEDLVPGDVILLEAGDAVPADARVLEAASLKAEEAALTGESLPVNKQSEALPGDGAVPLGDRKNMLYMGSTVVYGRGKAVVTATGMQTEMGHIAHALTEAENEATPLQKRLSQLSRMLTVMVLVICALMLGVSLLRAGELSMGVFSASFMLAVSLAVAAIPEGLAAVVTIVLSIGVTRMSARNAVIRRLTAVETLGCTQVICSDKTGTLTQNKMTVVKSVSPDEAFLARALALSSDSEINEQGEVVGEPTENALVAFAKKCGFSKREMKKKYPRVGEAPFDSMRKMMSTLHRNAAEYARLGGSAPDGVIQFTKGAPDEVLRRCSMIYTANGVREMTDADRAAVLSDNKKMADTALRVLAGAYRLHDDLPADLSPDNLEKDLVFLGLVGMIDPVRPEVKDAVAACHIAGVRVVMITGDHKDTAVAIGKELGILENADEAITGADIEKMSDEELLSAVEKYAVYARVQPEHKVRIVKAWRKKDRVVAMTGDGVNDAPSIKSADIGVGMGITGTDVTKNVADMILADDNFATIVGAVEEGRRIYANIRKAIQFLLSSNLSEVFGVFVATLLGFTLLKPAHMLWINLITDSLPALALGMEPAEKDSMKQPPRPARESLFSDGMIADVLYQGVLVALLTLAAYLIGHFMEAGKWEIVNSPDGMTMAFLTLSMAEIFHAFNMRSRHGSLFRIKEQNAVLWGSAAAALLLTAGVIYIPFFNNAFGFTSISLAEYGVAMALAFAVIPLVEIVKLCRRALSRRANKK